MDSLMKCMKRNNNLEVLRILACIFVVMSHVSSAAQSLKCPLRNGQFRICSIPLGIPAQFYLYD